VTRLPQAVRRRVVLILCTLLLGGLALSASRWRYRSGLFQGRTTSPHAHSVDLKWKASASHVVAYNVYRSDKSQGLYTKLNSSAVSTTNYTDVTVQAGHTYFYVVTAVDDKGHESLFSKQIKAVVPSP